MLKRFLLNFILFAIVPMLMLVLAYIVTDPFKTLAPFSLKNYSIVNRDYLSSELYLKNYKSYKFDSFIFGSSRACGLNTYLWKSHLPSNSRQFLFQAWGETITGISQKIKYIDNHGQKINNAIILIDIPSSFAKDQEQHEALSIKHYLFSGKPKLYYQFYLFLAYLKPTEIYKSFSDLIQKPDMTPEFDTISNDWYKSNKNNCFQKPMQDSTRNKSKFGKRPVNEVFSKKMIDNKFKIILAEINEIFKRQHTNCKIIISPAYDQLHVNSEDLETLKAVFGTKNVFNFSGKSPLTEDKYNFLDINHFDNVAGYEIMEKVFESNN